MKTYQSHKIVKASGKCSQVVHNPCDKEGFISLCDDNGEAYLVKDNFFARGEPQGAFYIVEYADGYRSWSPAEAFEGGYLEINAQGQEVACPQPQPDSADLPSDYSGTDFANALRSLRDGCKAFRDGWNGKGQFIYFIPANKYPASGNTLGTMKGVFPDDMVPYREYIAIKTADNTVVPWVASQSDLLATDWQIAA